MRRSTRVACWVNAGWMAFVWSTRIKNAVGDATLSRRGQVIAYGLSAVCLVGAALLAVAAWRLAARKLVARRLIVSVGVIHAAIWVVRGVAIAAGSRAVGFKVVHVVLALISIGLAGWMISSVRRVTAPGFDSGSSDNCDTFSADEL